MGKLLFDNTSMAAIIGSVLLTALLLSCNVSYSVGLSPKDRYDKIVFGCYTTDIGNFEPFVIRAKELGATHINITAEDLPKCFCQAEINDEISKLIFLKDIAAGEVGNENARKLLEVWLSLREVKKYAGLLKSGGCPFALGGVMQRWITRPLLDPAPVKEEEDIRRPGPDLVDQLQIKLNIMNTNWEDYKRIFNTPNK